jgi:hypothetical protein
MIANSRVVPVIMQPLNYLVRYIAGVAFVNSRAVAGVLAALEVILHADDNEGCLGRWHVIVNVPAPLTLYDASQYVIGDNNFMH